MGSPNARKGGPNSIKDPVLVKDHQPHDNCPNSLDCLPGTEGRPQHTLPIILRCTILGSARQRLTIRDIYAAMEKKYPLLQDRWTSMEGDKAAYYLRRIFDSLCLAAISQTSSLAEPPF